MTLLPIIYLAFITLGLPDSAVGAAWPSMYPSLGVAVGSMGFITFIIGCGTITSAFFTARLIRRLGTFGVTILSIALTAFALWGYSFCTEFWQMLLLAIPYGLGAGAIDAALNAYLSVNYPSRHVSWAHCMWGIGAMSGPLIMGRIMSDGSYAAAFRVLGIIQIIFAIIITASVPLWKKKEKPINTSEDSPPTSRPRTRDLLRISGVSRILVAFLCYCGIESTTGLWAASYLVIVRDINPAIAAAYTSLFYGGITAGRALSGFLTFRYNDEHMIRMGEISIGIGLAFVIIPGPTALAMVGLILMGLGCAPVFPSIIHSSPLRFGSEHAVELSGLQMASAFSGSLAVPPLFAFLAQHISVALYPLFILMFFVCMAYCTESVRKIAPLREQSF